MLLLLSNGMDAMLSGGLGKRTVGSGSGWWLKNMWYTFLQKSQGLVKKPATLMQAVVHFTVDRRFETYNGKDYLLS